MSSLVWHWKIITLQRIILLLAINPLDYINKLVVKSPSYFLFRRLPNSISMGKVLWDLSELYFTFLNLGLETLRAYRVVMNNKIEKNTCHVGNRVWRILRTYNYSHDNEDLTLRQAQCWTFHMHCLIWKYLLLKSRHGVVIKNMSLDPRSTIFIVWPWAM